MKPEPPQILLGPRTTVHELLVAYPFLAGFLIAYHDTFRVLERPGALTSWARVVSLGEVAVGMDVPWRRLVRDVGGEVTRVTGQTPRTLTGLRSVADDDRRLAELRDIAARLEAGGSLLDLADELRQATADLDAGEAAALEHALAGEDKTLAAADRRLLAVGLPDATPSLSPPGHPLHSASREADHVRRLCADLEVELRRLGGSPTRRRWCRERTLVASLVDRLSGVETRFRRQQQAWFPALAVYGVDGPATLLVDRQGEALELLRRLRLAVARDDAAFVVGTGHRLLEIVDGLLLQDEEVLAPLAERCFSPEDWVAVRDLEDGVGWCLLSAPPPWPAS